MDPPVNAAHRVSVFVLCHRRDEKHRDALLAQLAALEYQGLVDIWHEGKVEGGDDRDVEIERRLREAEIILLLVTHNWPALGKPLKLAMERQAAGTRLIPIRAAPAIDFAPLARIEPLPHDERPISQLPDPEQGWYEVALGVQRVVERMQASRAPLPQLTREPRGAPTEAKLLFLAARAVDAAWLSLEKEYGAIRANLRESEGGRSVALVYPGPVLAKDLAKEILNERPTILHFSGHGDSTGRLVFAGADDESDPMAPEWLAGLFRALNDQARIRGVVLNACYSRKQAEALRQHVDFVVGMARPIQDAAAIRFAAAFYLALGHGKNVKAAFELGCVESDLGGTIDTTPPRNLELVKEGDEPPTPVLLCREGVDPESTSLISAG